MYAKQQHYSLTKNNIASFSKHTLKERCIFPLTFFKVYIMLISRNFSAHHRDRLVSFNISQDAVHIIHVLVNHLYSDINFVFYFNNN